MTVLEQLTYTLSAGQEQMDLFSGHAANYARYRIDYPTALFEYVLRYVPDRQTAWDCATGNGQAAVALADHLDRKSVV